MSASAFMKAIEGCSIYADQLYEDGNEHFYLDQIAEYDEHKRFFVYPERFEWDDNKEFAWDLLLDDTRVGHELRHLILDGVLYDQIGMACDCDANWGQYCVIELGHDVEGIDDPEILKGEDRNFDWLPNHWAEEAEENRLPEFRLANDPNCPVHYEKKYCNVTDDDDVNYWGYGGPFRRSLQTSNMMSDSQDLLWDHDL